MEEKLRDGREFRRWFLLTAHRTKAYKNVSLSIFLVRSQRRCETIGGGREGEGRVFSWFGPHPGSKLRIFNVSNMNPLRTEHLDLFIYII